MITFYFPNLIFFTSFLVKCKHLAEATSFKVYILSADAFPTTYSCKHILYPQDCSQSVNVLWSKKLCVCNEKQNKNGWMDAWEWVLILEENSISTLNSIRSSEFSIFIAMQFDYWKYLNNVHSSVMLHILYLQHCSNWYNLRWEMYTLNQK